MRRATWTMAFLASVGQIMVVLALAVHLHMIGWYWSPPGTVDGNGGITIGVCGYELRGHVGPFCNKD